MSGIDNIGGLGALQNAQFGINRGLAGLNRDPSVIARATSPDAGDELTGALVDMSQQRLFIEMSARAMSVADQILGALLDTRA